MLYFWTNVKEKGIIIPLLYLIAITAAEVITALLNPQVGIICHAVILSALIFHASLTAGSRIYKLLLSLSIAPLIRILSLSMPLTGLTDTPEIYWFLIISLPILVATVVVMRSLDFKPREVGLTWGKPPIQLLIASCGVVLGAIEYQILRPEPLISNLSWGAVLVPGLILLVSTGFTEEFAFRGIMQRASAEALGLWGLVYTSLVFAVLHMGHLSLMELLFVFCVALFFAWVVKETGSLFGVTLCHGITNISLYLIMPFLLA